MSTSLYAPDFLAIFNRYRDTGGPLQAFASPADWRDQWIYFLMVDRFNNSLAPPRHQPFDDPNYYDFQGGNLASIQDQLPYIKQLGAGAIWLSPVLKNVPFQGGTYHGYGIHDFLHVDPRFARDPTNADDELRALVDAAHNLGLYIILDIVLNHTGDVFAYVCDSGETDCINSQGSQADFRPSARSIQWRDAQGNARADWPDVAAIPNPITRRPRLARRVAEERLVSPPGNARTGRRHGRRFRLAQAIPHRSDRSAAIPDSRLPIRDRPLRHRRVPHRHAALSQKQSAAAIRQRDSGVCAEHRQEEFLHLRRSFRGRRRRRDRPVHRPHHHRRTPIWWASMRPSTTRFISTSSQS